MRTAVAAPGGVDDDLDTLSQWQFADIGRREVVQEFGHSVVDDGHQQVVAIAEVSSIFLCSEPLPIRAAIPSGARGPGA
jgi:hypothetical protein